LPSSKPYGPEVQGLKVIINCPQSGSSRATNSPPPNGRWQVHRQWREPYEQGGRRNSAGV